MRPDYKNWVPKGMLVSLILGTVVALVLFIILGATSVLLSGTPRLVCGIIFSLAALILLLLSIWMAALYRAFDYNGKRQMAKGIIEGIAEYVNIPDGGLGLDVGCGSGALAIAAAKRNPNATIVGLDRWSADYGSFSKALCEQNAAAEGAGNIRFIKGNATNLDIANETYDAVMSNYVYHNITGKNKQELLLETLRVLKKGGTFAIHDIMSKSRYGDMNAFVSKLKDMGYEDVRLIDTTQDVFMSPKEGKWLDLAGSTLLVGRK